MDLKGSNTEKNLLRTFAGESRARNIYTFFAEKAREQGLQYVASIFEVTAQNEMAHAREVYRRYLRLVDDTSENLEKAAMGEAAESSRIYKRLEEEARAEGFKEIADFYKELAEVEQHHMERYMALKERLDNGEMFKGSKESVWQCMNCGYIHIGSEAPKLCPLCKYPQPYCKVYCKDYKEEEK
ncbi:MAG: rubrerythrin family protein [Clostridiaceae bacterium]